MRSQVVTVRVPWYSHDTGADYSVYAMRQTSRRSWRIGQTEPVQVVFMAYRNTLQVDALKLGAQKLQSSLAVEGELPEDGLAAYGDDGDDLDATGRRAGYSSVRSALDWSVPPMIDLERTQPP